jgi:hypothetical protein
MLFERRLANSIPITAQITASAPVPGITGRFIKPGNVFVRPVVITIRLFNLPSQATYIALPIRRVLASLLHRLTPSVSLG